jgi:hypothetical protein
VYEAGPVVGFGRSVGDAVGTGLAVALGVADADVVALGALPGLWASEPHATATTATKSTNARALMARGYRAKKTCFMTKSSQTDQP